MDKKIIDAALALSNRFAPAEAETAGIIADAVSKLSALDAAELDGLAALEADQGHSLDLTSEASFFVALSDLTAAFGAPADQQKLASIRTIIGRYDLSEMGALHSELTKMLVSLTVKPGAAEENTMAALASSPEKMTAFFDETAKGMAAAEFRKLAQSITGDASRTREEAVKALQSWALSMQRVEKDAAKRRPFNANPQRPVEKAPMPQTAANSEPGDHTIRP